MALYAFDGTWNKRRKNPDDYRNTNVVRFARCYEGEKMTDPEESYCYQDGVGSRWGLPGKLIGGLSGAGGKKRVRQMIKMLKKRWEAGDKVIDVVGFSRGAALALDFVNKLESPEIKKYLGNDVEVRFMALFDTVGSFGIPIGKIFQPLNVGYNLHLPGIVQHAYHAISLDDLRQTFRPTLPDGAYDVLFRGVHTDVGGGASVDNKKKQAKLGLSSISLYWMLKKAHLCNLPINEKAMEHIGSQRDPEEPLTENTDFVKNAPRKFSGRERFHYTISVRTQEGHTNPPENASKESKNQECGHTIK